jgi:hypothetical protein
VNVPSPAQRGRGKKDLLLAQTKKAKLRRSPSFASLHLSLNCEAGFRHIIVLAGITPCS